MSNRNEDYQKCAHEGCAGDAINSCEHGDFCMDHLSEHIGTSPVCWRRWLCLFADTARLMAEFKKLTDKHFPLRCAPLIECGRAHEFFIGALRGAYEQEGSPYGVGDEALWRWVEETEMSQPTETLIQ